MDLIKLNSLYYSLEEKEFSSFQIYLEWHEAKKYIEEYKPTIMDFIKVPEINKINIMKFVELHQSKIIAIQTSQNDHYKLAIKTYITHAFKDRGYYYPIAKTIFLAQGSDLDEHRENMPEEYSIMGW